MGEHKLTSSVHSRVEQRIRMSKIERRIRTSKDERRIRTSKIERRIRTGPGGVMPGPDTPSVERDERGTTAMG